MIFVDTGAFLARYLSRDQYHERALGFWDRLELQKERCFTSNFVLDETFTLLARRAGCRFAAEKARIIYSSKVFKVLRPAEEEELAALEFFEKFADQDVSFTDCISFVLLRKWKIKRVFAFDRHFRRAGFKVLP